MGRADGSRAAIHPWLGDGCPGGQGPRFSGARRREPSRRAGSPATLAGGIDRWKRGRSGDHPQGGAAGALRPRQRLGHARQAAAAPARQYRPQARNRSPRSSNSPTEHRAATPSGPRRDVPMTRAQVFFYVQHLLGIGHLRRAAAITRALGRHGLSVAFVAGGQPVPGLDLGDAEVIQLPPARAGDSGFGSIVDAVTGRPIDDGWRDRRRAALLATFQRYAPQVVLIELYPFGRRPFRFELGPLLEAAAAQRPGPAVLCSVRDILVSKSDPQRTAEIVDIIRRHFDLVLVHGDPRLIEFGATFAGADAIATQLRYTGYVIGEAPPIADNPVGTGEILVSAGGGAVGAP